MTAWRAVPDGLELRVRAQPRARRPGLSGLAPGVNGPRLRVAVTAAPEDGAANRAVAGTLAEALGVPPSAVTLLAGSTSREKLFRVRGESATLVAALERVA
ncbi:DUF167 domain-containing protein [Roseomonas sp. BN140053]|uniref:DUF167 domain-containing protein n=1 Tax=Roseomonas sp. BN140053 TaxID=3391898 RepID=UPI0039ED0959